MPPVSVGSAKSTSGVVVEGRAEKKPHAPPPPPRPRSHKTHRFRAFHGTERIHNARRQPIAATATGGPGERTAEEGREEKDAKKHLPLSLSLSPARIPRAERHSIDTSASTSRPVKPYTVGRQRAEYADPATR